MTEKTDWLSPLNQTHLLSDEIHIWLFDLNACTSRVTICQNFLSKDELTRVQEFRRDQTRQSFILVRWLLRSLLGHYLDRSPKEIALDYNDYGKPLVQGISFNLSHTERYAIYAFARRGQIGIDIEHLRPVRDFRGMAEKIMSETELAQLFSFPPEVQVQAFFNAWTRKEAIIKAIGKGLAFPLKSFSVEFFPMLPARVLTKSLATTWMLKEIPVPQGWAAALAYDQPDMTIKKWGISQRAQLAFIDDCFGN